MSIGWISLHRSLFDHWLWRDKPFSMGQAWVDLIMLANHCDKKEFVGGYLRSFQKGTVNRSIMELSERWGWNRKKTKRFLDVLESDQMVTVNSTTHGTTITIVNYEVFQDTGTTNDTTDGQPRDNHGTTTGQPRDINNNDNNVNNENKDNKYMDFITDVLNYLNQKTGKNYTGRSKAQKQHMVARIKEGFTVDDFKKVIDNKVRDWGNNPKMKIYLRPETLFGTKFETYLNDNEDAGQKKIREQEEINARQRANYDDETAHYFG